MNVRVSLLIAFGGFTAAAAGAQQVPTPSPAAAPHVATARAAAGQDHTALLNALCTPPPPIQPQPANQAATAAPPPPRSQWYAPPVKVFDNLYFVGQSAYSAWALVTSDGIIIIDPLFDYSVEEEVVNGLTKLGLDPARIRYVVVSHAHSDHVAGAALLQQRGARVVMSADDWELLATDPGKWPKAKKDIVAPDGYKLTLGDTTLTMHLTPGHTLGTMSSIFPVKDGNRTHTAALWGGTAFNWRTGSPRYITPGRPAKFWYDHYAASARKFRDIAAKAGADVLLSNHPQYDGSTTKLSTMGQRQPAQPHPYVIGTESISRFLTVAEACAKAGPLW
jgi:metallo-beta-lactamase class B